MRRSAADTTFQIGEFAARSGVTPDTLRYYERLGLLPRAHRTSGGFRVYTEQALDRVRFIKQARRLGLTLQEIRGLVSYQKSGGLRPCRDVRNMLSSKIADLEVRIAELQAFQATLSHYLEDCEQTLSSADGQRVDPSCPVIETLTTKKG
jgi:DNA-binding transcriptional MerR regulator